MNIRALPLALAIVGLIGITFLFTSQQVSGTSSPDFIDDALQFGLFTTSNMGTSQNPDGTEAEDADVDGGSTLLRTRQGVRMTIHTSGLDPLSAYTVWWVFFPDPANCTDPCGPDDERTTVYAAGFITDDSGVGNTSGTYRSSHAPVGWMIHRGDGILDNAYTNEVHLVMRNHGPAQTGLVNEQISTFGGGCSNAPPDQGTPGPFFCYNPQSTVHLAPTAP